jgi:hypothetical protein
VRKRRRAVSDIDIFVLLPHVEHHIEEEFTLLSFFQSKQNGMLVTLLTNGTLLTSEVPDSSSFLS